MGLICTAYSEPWNTGEILGRVRACLQIAVDHADEIVLEEANALVAVDTGELKASGHKEDIVDDGAVITGAVCYDADHAPYVEFGTGRRGESTDQTFPLEEPREWSFSPTWPGMVSQPYLRPALDTSRGQIMDLMRGTE